MRSTSVFQSFILTCAILLMANLLAGCDSSSVSKAPMNEDPSKVAPEKNAEEAEPSDTSAPAAKAKQVDGSESADGGLLTIGSTAPSLDIEHWLSDGHGKFGEVTDFESGKTYVVEFWATWCGPCIRSMPHLAELQESFADQGVQIISVSKEDLATVKTLLPRKYKSPEDDGPTTYGELTSAYCLTTDPDESVNIDYMKAARQNGIPCAFIVGKSGLIEYIGHPNGLEDPLQQVVDDKWDREKFAASFSKKQLLSKLQTEIMTLARQGKIDEAKVKFAEVKSDLGEDLPPGLQQLGVMVTMASVEQLSKAKRFDDAIAEVQQQREVDSGRFSAVWDMKLVQLLVEKKQYKKAAETLNDSLDDLPPQILNQIAWGIYEDASESAEIPAELLDAAIAASEKALEATPDNGAMLDTLAHLIHQSGDLDRAIEIETKAMENPGRAKAEIETFLKQLLKEKEGEEEEKEEEVDAS